VELEEMRDLVRHFLDKTYSGYEVLRIYDI